MRSRAIPEGAVELLIVHGNVAPDGVALKQHFNGW